MANAIGPHQNTAAVSRTAATVPGTASQGPPLTGAAGEQVDQVQLGVHSQPLAGGGRFVQADNGVTLNEGGGSHQLKLPTGEQIVWTDQAPAIGTGPQGAFSVQSYKADDGHNSGYSYTRPDGTAVSVNTDDMSVAYQDPSKSILQNVDAQGGEYIIAQGPPLRGAAGGVTDGPGPAGGGAAQKQVYITPDGQVHLLSGQSDGLQVSRTGISFDTPDHWKLAADFPVPLPGSPTGPLAAPLPAPPVAPPPRVPVSQPVVRVAPVAPAPAAPAPALAMTQFPVVQQQAVAQPAYIAQAPTYSPSTPAPYTPPPVVAPYPGQVYSPYPPPYSPYSPYGAVYPPDPYHLYDQPRPFALLDAELHHTREHWEHYSAGGGGGYGHHHY